MKTHKIVLALAAIALLATPLCAQELIVNGDFQAVPFDTGWDTGGVVGGVFQPVDGPAGGGAGDVAGELLNQSNNNNTSVKQGNLGAGSLVLGDMFNISFDARGTLAQPGGVIFAEFFEEMDGGGAARQEFLGGGPLPITSDWQTFNFTTTASVDVAGGVTLQFASVTGDAAGTSLQIDNVSMVRVPEPASGGILGLGALGMLLLRRRR